MAAEPPFIEIEGVSKHFGTFAAVSDVSLTVGKGEVFALLGGSGCGKTTLLRMLAGFEEPTKGRMRIDGQDMTGVPPWERPVHMMFQSYALFPHMSVEKNVGYGLKHEPMTKAQRAERVREMLDLVQLGPFAARKPHQISGGQRQRVALARALARHPKLLLLDEPLAALDKKLREQTQFELMSIQERSGVTFIVVTHDQEEAMTLADRIAVMDRGRVMQVGPPAEVYEHPTSRFVAGFIGAISQFEARVLTCDADQIGLDVPAFGGRVSAAAVAGLAPGDAVTLALRPEKIRLGHRAARGAECLRGAGQGSRLFRQGQSLPGAAAVGPADRGPCGQRPARRRQPPRLGRPYLAELRPGLGHPAEGLTMVAGKQKAAGRQQGAVGRIAQWFHNRGWRELIIAAPYLWLLMFFLLPFLIVIAMSVATRTPTAPPFGYGGDNPAINFAGYARLFSDNLYIRALVTSLINASVATVLCLLIGYPMALGLVRVSRAWRNILLMLVILPFWTSFLLRVYAWMGLMGRNSWFNRLLTDIWNAAVPQAWAVHTVPLMHSNFAVVLVMVYTYLPFMILPLFANLERLDLALDEAAMDLGTRPFGVFLDVTLPQSIPGIVAGGLLVFIPASGELVIPTLVGSSASPMIGRVISDEFTSSRDWPMASSVAVALLLLMVGPTVLYSHFRNRAEAEAERDQP